MADKQPLEGARPVQGLRADVWAALVLPPLAVVVLLIATFNRGQWTWLRITGLVVTCAAALALTWARLYLRNSFSLAPKAQALVTRGVYAYVRHPVYVLSTILYVGLVLYLGIPLMLIALIIIIPVQLARARREESMLEDEFGAAYRRYRSHTWF